VEHREQGTAQGETDPGHASPLRVGVLGASGYTGTELIQQLQHHPMLKVVFATSRQYAGESLREVDPSAPDLNLQAPDDVDHADADVVFICLPHGTTAEITEDCLQAGTRVVDLSGDLRLRSEQLHQQTYGTPRSTSPGKPSMG